MGDGPNTKATPILTQYGMQNQMSLSIPTKFDVDSSTDTDLAMAEAEAERALKLSRRPRSESSRRIRRWSKALAPPKPPPKATGRFRSRSKSRPEPPAETKDAFTRLSADPVLPFTGPTQPDVTSVRDLDNASPLTLGLCQQFPCHYCIFVYSRPSDVDSDTFPFRRNEFIAQINDAPHDEARRMILDSQEYRDAIRDRRVVYIEINTSCRIRLGELEGRKSLKKGLPRRRLTIAGPTFSHICVAVQLLEHMFPRLMQLYKKTTDPSWFRANITPVVYRVDGAREGRLDEQKGTSLVLEYFISTLVTPQSKPTKIFVTRTDIGHGTEKRNIRVNNGVK
nr:unnamed protein product [Spirometra erinaceieuropaei]